MITFITAIIVLASIGAVAWPLLRGVGRNRPGLVEDTEVSELLAQKDATLFGISELESDFNMGNLSHGDYQELRQKYEQKAVALIKAVDELRDERGLTGVSPTDEEIEAKVSELRAARETVVPDIGAPASKLPGRKRERQAPGAKFCLGCGAQLEAGDLFCFRCGAASSTKCPNCSAAIDLDDRFCSRCGTSLNTGGNGRKAG